MGASLSSGRFITLEGGEGAGKSTHAALLVDALGKARISVIRTREPGGAPGAEEIRRLLVEGEPERWDAQAEALLMVAARRTHLAQTIWPALKAGSWVVCDRFSDSTLAYQGYGGGVPLEQLEMLHTMIAGEFKPDLTIILDLPVSIGFSRLSSRAGAETRFERMGEAFHQRLRQGFLEIARREPERCVVVQADQAIEHVQQAIRSAIRAKLGIEV